MKTMTQRMFSLSALATAAVLGACATSRVPPPELLAARSVVRSAELDPQVLSHAPLELKKATDALARADRLSAKGESLADVTSAAYVAQRLAQTAMAVASAKRDEQAIEAGRAEREQARADARTAEAQRAQQQAAAAQQQAAAAQQQASAAQQQAATARERARDAEAQAQAARAQAAALEQQLAELQAQPTERGMLVTLGDLLFEFGRADLKPGAHDALRKLADYLIKHPERRILVEGHTDSVGGASANLLLSQQRAQAVASALVRIGVDARRIVTRGYGEDYPVADNGSDTNRALNRRVEVYISDGDQPVRARG